MKSASVLLIGGILAFAVAMSHVAQAGDQAGGVPALDARVSGLETTVAAQGAAGTTVQARWARCKIAGLQSQINMLQSHLTLFAVVDRDGTLRASRGVLSAGHTVDQSGNPQTGSYRVFFTRDLSLCAITVTPERLYSGQITGTINGTWRGFPNPFFSPNEAIISLFDEDGDFIDTRFNVSVGC